MNGRDIGYDEPTFRLEWKGPAIVRYKVRRQSTAERCLGTILIEATISFRQLRFITFFVFYESLSTGRKKFYLSRAGKKLSFIDSFTIAQRYDSIPVRNNSAIIETTRGEKKPPIFVIYLESTFHRIPQKKKNHTSRKNHAKQCLRSYEIRFVFVEPGRIYSRKFVPFEHGSCTMELHLSHVHSLKRNFTRTHVPSMGIVQSFKYYSNEKHRRE